MNSPSNESHLRGMYVTGCITTWGRAYLFARGKHAGQIDDDGNDYFQFHVCQVAELIKMVSDNKNIWAAAYLHDVLEDTRTTYPELKRKFGKEIADLVREVTHEGKKSSGYYFPHLKSREAILLKFADRLSNLSRMKSWSDKRKSQYLKKSKFWKSK